MPTSKFIYLEIVVELDNGQKTRTAVEHLSVNVNHIVKFTSYGKFMWLHNGDRYTLTDRGFAHLTEYVRKIELDTHQRGAEIRARLEEKRHTRWLPNEAQWIEVEAERIAELETELKGITNQQGGNDETTN